MPYLLYMIEVRNLNPSAPAFVGQYPLAVELRNMDAAGDVSMKEDLDDLCANAIAMAKGGNKMIEGDTLSALAAGAPTYIP
jgi:hypothetical protein